MQHAEECFCEINAGSSVYYVSLCLQVKEAETRMTKQNKATLFAGAGGLNPENSNADNAVIELELNANTCILAR